MDVVKFFYTYPLDVWFVLPDKSESRPLRPFPILNTPPGVPVRWCGNCRIKPSTRYPYDERRYKRRVDLIK